MTLVVSRRIERYPVQPC